MPVECSYIRRGINAETFLFSFKHCRLRLLTLLLQTLSIQTLSIQILALSPHTIQTLSIQILALSPHTFSSYRSGHLTKTPSTRTVLIQCQSELCQSRHCQSCLLLARSALSSYVGSFHVLPPTQPYLLDRYMYSAATCRNIYAHKGATTRYEHENNDDVQWP